MSQRRLSFNLGLEAVPPATEDPQYYGELIKIYNAIQNIAYYFERYAGPLALTESERALYGIEAVCPLRQHSRYYPEATEDLVAFDAVAIDNTGKVSKANANSSATLCSGIVLSNTASGFRAEVCLIGAITGFGGLVPGSIYYLSTTDGTLSNSPPGAGNYSQKVGRALTATTLFFNPSLESTLV
jgi:hypothetical protein